MDPLFFFTTVFGAMALGHVVVRLRGLRTIGLPSVAFAMLPLAAWALIERQPTVMWITILSGALGLLVPMGLYAGVRRNVRAGRISRALIYGRPLASVRRHAWIRLQVQTLEALASLAQGDDGPALALIDQLTADGRPLARPFRDWLLGATGQWEAVSHSSTLELASRALAELGRVDEAVELTGRLWGRRRMRLPALNRAREAVLPSAAFAGRLPLVEALCRLLQMSQDATDVWRATALAAAGQRQEARRLLIDLSRTPDLAEGVRLHVQRRLAHLPEPAVLGASAEAVLAEVRREVAAGLVLRFTLPWRQPLIALVALGLIGVHLYSMLVGEGVDAREIFLMQWALLVDGTLPMEAPWRVLTYGLVHYDALHLGGNLLGLGLFGPLVVRTFGVGGFALLLVGSTAGAGVCISLLGSDGITLGISGGVMGLLGGLVIGAFKARGLAHTRTGQAVAQAGLALMVLQSGLDMVIPEISFVGHLSGGLVGVLLATGLVLAGVGQRAVGDQPP